MVSQIKKEREVIMFGQRHHSFNTNANIKENSNNKKNLKFLQGRALTANQIARINRMPPPAPMGNNR